MADHAQSRHPGVNAYRLDIPTLRRARIRTNFYDVANRRRRALHFREGGLDNIEIGYQLAADPAINTAQESVPSGYGWYLYVAGKPPPSPVKLGAAVSRDIARGIEETRKSLAERSQVEFDMSLRRLDRLISFMWPGAAAGDHWHAFRVLQIEERRARMWGWDSERRVLDAANQGSAFDVEDIPAQLPAYTTEYVNDFYSALLEAGLVPLERADLMIGMAEENGGIVAADPDVVDAVVIEDSASPE